MAPVIDVYSITLVALRGSTIFDPDDPFLCSGRIILPQSCLRAIVDLSMVYPLQFRISLQSTTQRGQAAVQCLYATVLEFTAERGKVVLPDWMADHLRLPPSSSSTTGKTATFVQLQTCSLGGANKVTLQPHSSSFTSLSDPREVLERQLLNYPILTRGTSIIVRHAKTNFLIRIASLLDHRQREVEAVLSARADLQATEVKVEFEPPMDTVGQEEEEEDEEVLWAPTASKKIGVFTSETGSNNNNSGSVATEKKQSPQAKDISFYPSSRFQPPHIDSRIQRLPGTSSPSGSQDVAGVNSEETHSTNIANNSGSSSFPDARTSFTPFTGHGRTLINAPSTTTSGNSDARGGISSNITSAGSFAHQPSGSLSQNSSDATANDFISSKSGNALTPEQVRAARMKWLQNQSEKK